MTKYDYTDSEDGPMAEIDEKDSDFDLMSPTDLGEVILEENEESTENELSDDEKTDEESEAQDQTDLNDYEA